jgi:hypothetical protein
VYARRFEDPDGHTWEVLRIDADLAADPSDGATSASDLLAD